jgi:Domain of unknown function (DUF5666)
MQRRVYALCFALVITTVFAGCNASKSNAPTAPTAAAPDSSVAIDLNVITPPGTVGAGVDKPVVGTVGPVTGTCPDVAFVLAGVRIRVNSRTTFESGTCADIKEGITVGAMGTKNADGSVEARRVKIAPTPPPHAEGPVSGLTGTCPALTFTLSGTPVRTTDRTQFEGGTCADLKEGGRAGASGPQDAAGVITAQHVKIAPPPPAHVEGPVTGLGGTCPALTFTLAGTTVHTTDKTVFDGGTCADVKEGGHAGATGPKDASGAINAARVRLAAPLPHVGGVVSSTTGTCPAIAFVVTPPASTTGPGPTTVRTSEKTRFEGGSCGDVKVEAHVGAMGPKAADGAIEALVVKIAPK